MIEVQGSRVVHTRTNKSGENVWKGNLPKWSIVVSDAVLVLHLRDVRLSILYVSESYHTCASYFIVHVIGSFHVMWKLPF